jgi:hypothetical protein
MGRDVCLQLCCEIVDVEALGALGAGTGLVAVLIALQ